MEDFENASVEATTGETTPVAEETNGVTAPNAEGHEETVDRNAEYSKFKSDYKDLYDADVQKIVQRRLRGSKETEAKLNSVMPFLTLAATKYGVDANDINGLTNAFNNDNAYWEERAANEGLTVDQAKHVAQLEANERARIAEAEEQATKQGREEILNKWLTDSEALKSIYPDFDFDNELDSNEKFSELLGAGIDVKTAYEVIHKDELIQGAMKQTAHAVKGKMVNDIQARGHRPAENGFSSQASAVTKFDFNNMTRAQREQLEREAARGKRIPFV